MSSLSVGTAATASTTVRPRLPAPTGSQELQAALDDVVAAGASGAALRVDGGHRKVRLASGAARLTPWKPLHPKARLRVGSITKTFVATVTLQLVGEGRLRLDDTVARWQPGLIPNGDQITVRQLLNHTSGIFNYTDDEAFVTAVLADPLQEYTPEELVAIATSYPPDFAPGTGWNYSNTNYIVLGLILEQATGRSLSSMLERRIIRPLRLRHTLLPVRSPRIPGYHARGYVPPSLSDLIPPPRGSTGDYVDVTKISPTTVGAAGALISNLDDLRTFFRALLSGRLLHPDLLAEMKTTVDVNPGYSYGLGLYSIETPCGRMWGHDGGVPGYTTVAWSDERGRRGFVYGMPTFFTDAAIDQAMRGVAAAAACRALGQPLPSDAEAGATTMAAGDLSRLPALDSWVAPAPRR